MQRVGVHLGHGENEQVRMVRTFLGFLDHIKTSLCP